MKYLLLVILGLFAASTAFAASVCITVPPAAVPEVLNAFGYQATLPDPSWLPIVQDAGGTTIRNPTPQPTITNPETSAQFMQRMAAQFMLEKLRQSRARAAMDAASMTPTPGIQ